MIKHLTKDINLSDKTVLLMGLGLNGGGLGTAKFLSPRVKKLIITDLKDEKQLLQSISELTEFKNIEYRLSEHRIEDFINSDIVFKGAGIKYSNKYILSAIENNVYIETDIGYFFEITEFPKIGITGSKGKSTTTSLIHHILSKEIDDIIIGGNITINPLLELQSKLNSKLAVLELSSWQLADLSIHEKSPNISVITTLFPDHLNYYNCIDDYYQDKKYIFKFQNKDDYFVFNFNNEYLKRYYFNKEINAKAIFVMNFEESQLVEFGFQDFDYLNFWFPFCILKIKNRVILIKDKNFSDISDISFLQNIDKKNLINLFNLYNISFNEEFLNNYHYFEMPSLDKLKINGEHNKTNALLAISVALLEKISIKNIYEAIDSFSAIQFRLETIRILNEITFINDTTATVPDAVSASIEAVKENGRIHLIAGGVDKNLPIDKMANSIKNHVYRLYLLTGSGSNLLKQRLENLGYDSIEYNFNDLVELVKYVYDKAESGDIILLSPGFASFNLFVNEFERGKIFNNAVIQLK